MQELIDAAKAYNDQLIAHRRFFHQNPETGLQMPVGSRYVIDCLQEMGYEPQVIGGYSVVATVGGKKPGKVFLIRADMDALPMAEDTALPFRSDNGCMHACGHDCHAAMLLGAAKLLKEREGEICGTVKLFFQTAEETLEGAREAVEAGLLENPKVDGAMMIHIISGTPLPDGMLAVFGDGPCYASADWYRVDVTGKGGHGAMPQSTISAVNMITAVNTAIGEIMSVVVPPAEHAVMTVGQIHAGDTSNIIPETAFLSGTIRTFDESVRATIKEKLAQAVEGIAAARGGSGKVSYTNTSPAVVCDDGVRQSVLKTAQKLVPHPAMAADLETMQGGAYNQVTGSEDFAYIAQKVPSAVAWLSAGTPEGGYPYPSHNPKTDFKEDVLYMGTALYACAAMEWLAENQ